MLFESHLSILSDIFASLACTILMVPQIFLICLKESEFEHIPQINCFTLLTSTMIYIGN